MGRKDLLKGFRFRLEIDGVSVAGFGDAVVDGTRLDRGTRSGGAHPRRAPRPSGPKKFSTVVLKGGVTDSQVLSAWQTDAAAGTIVAGDRDVVIAVVDDTGTDVARYTVKEAWPVKYQSTNLKADANEVAIESLELSSEGIEPVS